VRSDAERALFARLRAAFDPAGILNPYVLPRWPPSACFRPKSPC